MRDAGTIKLCSADFGPARIFGGFGLNKGAVSFQLETVRHVNLPVVKETAGTTAIGTLAVHCRATDTDETLSLPRLPATGMKGKE